MDNIHTDVGLYLHFLEGFMIKNGGLFFFFVLTSKHFPRLKEL